jgi:hypothetical protein
MGQLKTMAPTKMHLLTEAQASEVSTIPCGTLRHWRSIGVGPNYVKLGDGPKARVRYKMAELVAFVERGERNPNDRGIHGGMHGGYQTR